MTNEQIEDVVRQYLREKLSIEIKERSVYTGGMGNGPLYEDTKTLVVKLDEETIAEVWL